MCRAVSPFVKLTRTELMRVASVLGRQKGGSRYLNNLLTVEETCDGWYPKADVGKSESSIDSFPHFPWRHCVFCVVAHPMARTDFENRQKNTQLTNRKQIEIGHAIFYSVTYVWKIGKSRRDENVVSILDLFLFDVIPKSFRWLLKKNE